MSKERAWKERADNVPAVLMVIAAAAALVYQLFEKTGWLPVFGQPIDVLLFLVALLTAATGLQKIFHLQYISDSIENIESNSRNASSEAASSRENILRALEKIEGLEEKLVSDVKKITHAEILLDKQRIEDAAIEIIKNCANSDNIKATAQYLAPSTGAGSGGLSERYYRAIAKKISLAQQAGVEMIYKVILPASPQDRRESAVGKRKDIFEQFNVSDKMNIRFSNVSWPIEILIAGECMILAFSGRDGLKYNVGLRVSDSKFIEHMRDWYLETAWNDASSE